MFRSNLKKVTLLVVVGLFFSACNAGNDQGTDVQTSAQASPKEAPKLTVMTHDSFSISEQVMNAFTEASGIEVRFLKSDDTGTAVNKAVLAKDKPLADVFYGVDNTFLSRALEEGLFETYESPLLKDIPDHFKLDPQNGALPVDFGDVCLNFDKAYFAENN
ncbi:unnamed protein product, partial [marine sediment metagenome]